MSRGDPAQAIYDRLWAEARDLFAAGRVRTDPHLSNRAADARRGISLIIRPSPDMIARMGAVIDELRAIVPGSISTGPANCITLLSLISVSAAFDLSAAPLDRYRALFENLFPRVQPMNIHFSGVTASPDSVFVFGYAEDGALNTLRDHLRDELTHAGLGDGLDRRYRSVTAHSTILRFQTLPESLPELVRFLETARTRDLGTFRADQVEFVFNDWYMTQDVVRVLARYPLGAKKV
jgi:2'-5' RNA ligase